MNSSFITSRPGPKPFDTLILFMKDFEKVGFEKKTTDDNKNMKSCLLQILVPVYLAEL